MLQWSRARAMSRARHPGSTRPHRPRLAHRRGGVVALALGLAVTIGAALTSPHRADAAPFLADGGGSGLEIVSRAAAPADGTIAHTTVASSAITITAADLASPDRDVITSFAVTLAIDHGFIGDLTVTLENPAGGSFTLLDRPGLPFPEPGRSGGGSAASLSAEVPIVFSDHAPSGRPAELMGAGLGVGQTVGLGGEHDAQNPDNYIPVSGFTIGGLDQFVTADSASLLGEWTIHVADASPGAAGTLHNWSLTASVIPEPTTGMVVLVGLGAAVLMRRARRRAGGCAA